MAMNKERQLKAANKLEELSMVTKEFIVQLRMGQSNELAYAMVYYLRRELGYVVRDMGEGVPSADHTRIAEEVAEAEIWNNL